MSFANQKPVVFVRMRDCNQNISWEGFIYVSTENSVASIKLGKRLEIVLETFFSTVEKSDVNNSLKGLYQ